VRTTATRPWFDSEAAIVAPVRRCDLQEEELDGEAMLYHPATGRTFRLNETSLLVWRGCDGRNTTRDLAAMVTTKYEVDFAKALDHVEQLLLVFAEAELVGAPVASAAH
jgi:hypothetical protein